MSALPHGVLRDALSVLDTVYEADAAADAAAMEAEAIADAADAAEGTEEIDLAEDA
jgi:hypothetical protein